MVTLSMDIELLFELRQRCVQNVNHFVNLLMRDREGGGEKHDVARVHVESDKPVFSGKCAQRQSQLSRRIRYGACLFVQHDFQSTDKPESARISKARMLVQRFQAVEQIRSELCR